MEKNKQKNLIMILIVAAILSAVNVGVLLASNKGIIVPIENLVLWGVFVVLNVASILWAISLLGLQPFVVSISYVAGGLLAYLGVRGHSDISVAEVTTAGATYGAFGALAIGNVTAKVRLAFFKKGQVPFIFIMVGLLVVDAALNSGISRSNGSVILYAVVIPFVVAGIVVGLIWSVLNRFAGGRKPAEVVAEEAEENAAEKAETLRAVAAEKMVIQMPEPTIVAEEKKPVKKAESVAPVVPVAPIVAAVVEAIPEEEKEEEEHFFPLEIDKNDAYEPPAVPLNDVKMDHKDASLQQPTFDNNLYDSGSVGESSEGSVVVKEPEVSATLGLDVIQEEESISEEVSPEPNKEAAPEKKDDDWLGGHLDLLNKLK